MAADWLREDDFTCMGDKRESLDRLRHGSDLQSERGTFSGPRLVRLVIQHVVLPNAGLFSFLVTWGEVAVGVGLLLGILTEIAAGFGVLMNLNYLLAGTVSINPILGMFGLFLCFAWRVCGWIGIDRWLLPALSLPWKPGTWFRSPTTEAPISPVEEAMWKDHLSPDF